MDSVGQTDDRPAENPLHHGTGPGVITPDGCAVEFYALLGPGHDADLVHASVPAGASILELGCGAGRVSSALVDLGHLVVAVDESAEMLAHVTGAQTVLAKIENLRLDRRFDVVLLASHLLNTPDDQIRRAFLDTCARHVNPAGSVLIQHHPAGWFDETGPSERVSPEGFVMRMSELDHPAPELVSATVQYEVGDRVWTHSFVAKRLSEAAVRAELAQVGLAFDSYLTQNLHWIRARPV